jgi:hypothetical protein
MTLPGLVAAKNLADVADRERVWDNLGLTITANLSLNSLDGFIGAPLGGGFFAGYISHTANSIPTHALIVAPRPIGATGTGYELTAALQLKTTQTVTANTDSLFDGLANTNAMIAAGIADHPAAQFCTSLTEGGYSDWYLPALAELDIAYFNLKPTSTANSPSALAANIYAVPRRDAVYSSDDPRQSSLGLFNGGGQSFATLQHWSSTQFSSASHRQLNFLSGAVSSSPKTASVLAVRAFRRVAI